MTNTVRPNFKGKPRKVEQPKDAKPLPSNLDAERIVCATFMAHNHFFETFLDRVKAADFLDPFHRQIFTIGARLVVEGKPANSATIASQITELAPIPDLTVPAYMRELNKFIQGKDKIDAYVSEVALAAKRRAVLELAERFASMAHTGGHELVDQLSSAVALLAGGSGNAGMQHIKPFIDGAYQAILTNDAAGWGPTGYRSDFREIDMALGGWKRKKMYILAAMEKAGKTALMLSLCRQFLLQDIPCAIFSLELKNEEIAERLIMLESELNIVNRPQGMTLLQEELEHLTQCADRCESWPLYSNDLQTLSPSAIKMNARHAVRVHGAKVIFLDYVQIVEGEEGDKADDTRKRVERASKAMRQIAKELDVVVICLAQLNRKALERSQVGDWKGFDANAARPRRGDLRETAALEMDADAIVTIYQQEILFKQMKPFDEGNTEEMIDYETKLRSYKIGVLGKAELGVLLNRSGPDGVRCDCHFRDTIMRFEPAKR